MEHFKKFTMKGAEKITERLIIDLIRKRATCTASKRKAINVDVKNLSKILRDFERNKIKKVDKGRLDIVLNRTINRYFTTREERKKYYDVDNGQRRTKDKHKK